MWTYYLFWMLASTALALISAHPAVLVVVVVFIVARRWMPDPVRYLQYAGRIRRLRSDIELNPANATARTQLAEIWLDKRRPARAIPLLRQALDRDPKSAELLYLLGLALLRTGEPESALEPLSEALYTDDRVRYGNAYLAIADALSAVDRLDESIGAYERFLKINTSSLEGYVKLARVNQRHHDEAGARKARDEGLDTYRRLPSYQRRKQLRWWLALKLTRL